MIFRQAGCGMRFAKFLIKKIFANPRQTTALKTYTRVVFTSFLRVRDSVHLRVKKGNVAFRYVTFLKLYPV